MKTLKPKKMPPDYVVLLQRRQNCMELRMELETRDRGADFLSIKKAAAEENKLLRMEIKRTYDSMDILTADLDQFRQAVKQRMTFLTWAGIAIALAVVLSAITR